MSAFDTTSVLGRTISSQLSVSYACDRRVTHASSDLVGLVISTAPCIVAEKFTPRRSNSCKYRWLRAPQPTINVAMTSLGSSRSVSKVSPRRRTIRAESRGLLWTTTERIARSKSSPYRQSLAPIYTAAARTKAPARSNAVVRLMVSFTPIRKVSRCGADSMMPLAASRF
jgi:hypothetical protein